MQDLGLGYGLVKFVHIVLFVYWLGGDAGVFYSSGFVVNPKLTREARMTAAKIFIELDMLPRYCLAMMLTVGGILAAGLGVPHKPWQWPLILALGPLWVWLVWMIHHKQGTALGAQLARFDLYFRWFMVAAIIASVSLAWYDGRLRPYPWLAAKLLIFATLVFSGLMIRLKMPKFMVGFRQLMSTGPTPESDAAMIEGLRACRPYVLYIWAGVAAAALIGVLKPGGLPPLH
jgi:hypothetical protein